MTRENTNKIAFLGSALHSIQCLEYLVSHCPSACVAGFLPCRGNPTIPPEGDSSKLLDRHNITVIQPEELFNLEYDLGISILYDSVLPGDIVAAPEKGWINLHLGPLPRLRGVNSVLHGIRLAREEDNWTFGITLHYMVEKVDAGPIIEMKEFPIHKDDTAYALFNRTVDHILPLFSRNIRPLLDSTGKVGASEQKGPSKTFYKRDKIDHEIDLSWSADKIRDRIRALTFPGKPGPYINIGGKKFNIVLD